MQKFAFIGAGNMVGAIVRGMLNKGIEASSIACCSGSGRTARSLASDTGIGFAESTEAMLAAESIKVVVLGMKPQQLADMPDSLAEQTTDRLIISILAGTTLETLRRRFPKAVNIVRVMPNTPSQIGAGMTGYSSASALAPEEEAAVKAIVDALGPSVQINEQDMDALTGVSGSGPAYVFEFIAALRDAGIREGLEPTVASKLALQTVLGAAQLVEQTGEEPEALRDKVTSPNGTTFAALSVLGEQGFRDLIHAAVHAARRRSEELSRQ